MSSTNPSSPQFAIPAQNLQTGGPFLQRLSRFLLPLIGWKIEGQEFLTAPQYVVVVAPHTSNWDLPIGLICAHAFGFFRGWQCGFMIKESATQWPILGPVIKEFGGIPIRRSAPQDVVDQMVEVFRANPRMIVAITPEGTRAHREYWKTGFYRIALRAQVPLALAFIDYKRHVAGVGQILIPTGDLEADFKTLADFYSNITAKFPQSVGPVQVKPEPPSP